MPPRKPKKPQVKPQPLSALAGRLDISAEAVRKAVARGVIREAVVYVAGKAKILDLDLAEREYRANTQPRTDAAAAPTPLLLARVRREQAAADHAELELAQRRSELIPIADARRDVAEKFTIVKTRLLAVPSRVAQRLPHVASFVLPVLDELLREALDALADGEA